MPIFFYYTPKTPRKPPHLLLHRFLHARPLCAENISVSSLTAALVTALETKMHHATKGVGARGTFIYAFPRTAPFRAKRLLLPLGHP